MKKSEPDWITNGVRNDIEVDGYLGLVSTRDGDTTSDSSINFLDQITGDLIDKKMLSIYIAEDSDSDNSSILFGGSDDDAYLDETPKT